MTLTDAAGAWTGTNGFRLMPADTFSESPAGAVLTVAAGGAMVSFAYAWEHPVDGPQDGLITVASAGEDALTALWADSWHQQPSALALAGTLRADGVAEFRAEYAEGWFWRITLDGSPGEFRMQMENEIPAELATEDKPADPYTVMGMVLLRP
ncbi:hypothetical protein F4553_001121 [Allocatelliglobosispora scoriae]|uniref:DUF1579 domain-containing protein n=1 Tax=Allocatelliglobosispora scoriae TaxID=643052 RepID=A0A841BLW5_9ACTN|nr:hypothetical protein [Allocatelliglobosispora scoriae]MBB5867742.1 hypothetical protein [Allocatelliglobosispora scoriae]